MLKNEMVKYTLLHKPTLSSWPSVPRQVKTIIVGGLVIAIIFLIVVQSTRNSKLRELYNIKGSISEIVELEIKYMSQSTSDNDRWVSASVPEGIIYSAYLDTRPEIVLDDLHHDAEGEKTWAVIRVITVQSLLLDDKPLTCYYKYKVDNADQYRISNRTASRVRAIKEHWYLKYSAFFVLCDLTLPVNTNYDEFYYGQHLPVQVSLGSTNHEDLLHMQFVDVHYPLASLTQPNVDEDDLLAVCVPVLHHEYSRALHLVEYVEYHSMMGVNHFTFYNESVTPEVSKVLEYYAQKGLATILDWKLPPIYKFELTLRVDGIFAALNDCLYRNSFHKNFKYVLTTDVDEFIVPRIHKDFKELLHFLDPPHASGVRNKHASFQFRNVFFYLMYPDDKTDYDPHVPYLYLQAKTQRVKTPEPSRTRSKYIVRSQDVVELGNHNVWANRPGASVFSDRFDEGVVDESVALSHHYRDCEAETAGCYFRPTIVDYAAHKFIKNVGQRVKDSCTAIFKGSGCPVPTD